MASIFLKDWLSNPEYWFNPKNKYDNYININYSYLLQEEWDKNIDDIKYHLSYVIIYDQLPRHLYREPNEFNKNKIEEYLKKSLEVYNFTKQNYDISTLSIDEWCFFSLPLRHTNIHKNIFKVLNEAWIKLENTKNKNDFNKLIRFIKASYQRIPKTQITEIEEHLPNKTITDLIYFKKYSDILEYCPLILNDNDITIRVYKVLKFYIKHNNLKNIQISLSGGVDSMICSYIIKKLEKEFDLNIHCLFINYCNRTHKEFEFVRDWCNFIEIPLYVRHINEFTREQSMKYSLRDIYESYTKDIRFNTYCNVWEHLGNNGYPQVILGHNKNDCFENILTNICYKIKYDNLKGMNNTQLIDNIIFHRPLIDISKEEIYEYSHFTGIPYLVDSTPKWCQRGKIRDIVRPCLEEWNINMINSLFNLSERMSDYSKLENTICNNMFNITNKTINGYELSIPLSQLIIMETIWKKYFYLCNINISNKCLEHFIKYMKKIINKGKSNISSNININLNYSVSTRIQKDNILYIKIINNL